MPESAEPQRFKYAVCPRISRSGSTETPIFRKTKSLAMRFLNSEVAPRKLAAEAKAAGLSLTEFKAQRRGFLKVAAAKVKRGDLHPFDYPKHLEPILNKHEIRQDPVPVSNLAQYTGAKCTRTLRDFLPAETVGPMPELNLDEEIDRVMEGRTGDYSCCLGADWLFDEIQTDASKRVGHELGARRGSSIAGIVVNATHDVEAAIQKLHPHASCTALADFWQSWQIQRYIADFYLRLVDYRMASMNDFEPTTVGVYRLLAVFAHELLDDAGPSLALTELDEHVRRVEKLERHLLDKGITQQVFGENYKVGRTVLGDWKARKWDKLKPATKKRIEGVIDAL